MRKTKGNVANKTKNNGKFRNIKRYIAASAAVVLAASVVMSSVVKKTEAAENADTLMGIEKLRSSFTSKDKCFTVLEIVPDVEVENDGNDNKEKAAIKAREAADIGYLFDGYEPALSSWDYENQEWVSWKDELFTVTGEDIEGQRRQLINEKIKNLTNYYTKMGLMDTNGNPIGNLPISVPKEDAYEEWNGEGSNADYVEVKSDDYEQTGYFALVDNYKGKYNLIFEQQGKNPNSNDKLYYGITYVKLLTRTGYDKDNDGNFSYSSIPADMPIYFQGSGTGDTSTYTYAMTWAELKAQYDNEIAGLNVDKPIKVNTKDDKSSEDSGGKEEPKEEEPGDDSQGDGTDTDEDGKTDEEDHGSDDTTDDEDNDSREDSDLQPNTAFGRQTSQRSTWKKLVNGLDDESEDGESNPDEGEKEENPGEGEKEEEPGEGEKEEEPGEGEKEEEPGEGEKEENPGEGENEEESGEGEKPEEGDDEEDGSDKNADEKKAKTDEKIKPDRATWNNQEGDFYILEFTRVCDLDNYNGIYYAVKKDGVVLTGAGQYDFVPAEGSKAEVQTYKFPDKVLFCKGVFRNNEWFKKYVLNMSEENFDDFHVKVITLTPDELEKLYQTDEGIPEFHFLYLNSGERNDIITISELAARPEGGNIPRVPGDGPEIVDEDEPDEEDGDETDEEDGNGEDDGNGDGDGTGEGDGSEDGDNPGTEDGDDTEGGNGDETGAGDGDNPGTGDGDNPGTDDNKDDEITPVTKSGAGRNSNISGWTVYVSETEETEDPSDSTGTPSEEDQSETTTGSDEEEQPGTPADPADGEEPGTPADPTDEEEPGTPTDPTDGEEPGTPTDPADGEEPGTPEDSGRGEKQDVPPVRAPYNTANSDLSKEVSNELFKRVSSKALACLVDGHILFAVDAETGKLEVKDGTKTDQNGNLVDGTNTEMFRLALMMCQESLEKDYTGVSTSDLRDSVVEDADKNFATDQVYCRYGYALSTAAGGTKSGYDSIVNALFFVHNFYREGGEMDPGFQKVLDEIILENLYRASDTSGDFKPLPTDIGQAETVRHILNYQNSRSVEAKKDIKVLEIQPARTDTPQLTKEMIQEWAPGVETVETTVMTTAEFIGRIEKINEIYDLVYLGSSKEHLNISNWITDSGMSVDKEYKGSTVFNDKDMDGLIYYNVGDKRVVDLVMAGLLDSEYPSGNGTGRPYYYNFVRYSGNDITKEKRNALLAFLDGSYPIVVSEDFIEQPVTLFEKDNYAGRRATLQVGEYTKKDLENLQIYSGAGEKGISSIKIKQGYKITLFNSDDLSGTGTPVEAGDTRLNYLTNLPVEGSSDDRGNSLNWNNRGFSIRVEKIETATPVKAIDTDHIDNSSYMYEFVDIAMRKSYTNFFAEGDIDKTGSELFKFYLNRPKASLVNFTANGLQEDVYNDAYYIYPMSDGKYYLQYSFSIKNEGAASMATKYNCKLYIDVNADGKFSESEEVTDIVMTNRNSGALVSANELYAGVEYTIRREVPTGYKGLLPWKVEVCQVGNDNIYASKQGYTKLQGMEKETITVLQIHRNVNQVIKLDEEINTPGERHYFNTLVKGGTHDGIVYKGIEDDFELEVTTMSTVEFQNRWYYTAQNGYEKGNPVSEENGILMDNYNMLILGFSDMYDNFDGDDKTGPMSAIVDFINSGKSVLLAHDTTSFFNVPMVNGEYLGYPWRNNLNDARGFNNDGRFADSLNKYVRPLVGMDRYAVLKNATVKKGAVLHEGDAEWNNLFSTGTEIAYKPKSGRTETVPEAQGYTYALISAKDRKSAGGDERIPRQQYTKWNLYSSGYNNLDEIVFENKYTNQRFDRVWFWDSSSDDGGDMNVADKNSGEVDEVNVTQVNQGQLTEYPYKLKDKFEVAITHNQYYQLDYTADDDGDGQSDLVVWYCLGDRNPPDGDSNKKETIYSMSPNDVRNNYYIYNKGNITYTGMGHARKDDWREPYTFEEAKLFINTMIAAYQAGMKAPNIDILESGRADAPKIKTLYRHFDEINMIPLSDAVTETYEKVYFKVTDLNFVKGTRTIETHVFYETSAGTETITVGTDDIVVNRLEDRFYDPVTETPVAADALDSGGVYYIEVPKSILDDCENGLDLYFEAQSTIIPYTNNQASLTPEEIEKRTRRTDKVYAKLKVLRSYLFELD